MLRKAFGVVMVLFLMCLFFTSCNGVLEEYTLTISVEGKGEVVPSGGTFLANTSVDLTVIPQAGWEFSGWAGEHKASVVSLFGEEHEFKIVMNENKEIIGVFERIAIKVPDQYDTIQEAIDAAEDGGTILVAPGVYKENITFKGKAIVLRSIDPGDDLVVESTVIDGGGMGRVVTFNNGESEQTVLWGFTITNGDAKTGWGGGIIIDNGSSPTLKGNIITENKAYNGGGLWINNQSSPIIQGNTFLANHAVRRKGVGIYITNESEPLIKENILKDHEGGNGVIYIEKAGAVIFGNTIKNNSTDYGVGGIMVDNQSAAVISQNTITHNTGRGDIYAGAIAVINRSEAEIKENSISYNLGIHRGAVVVHNDSRADIINNTISNNSAGVEGGLYGSGGGISLSRDSSANLSANIIAHNVAWHPNGGGGGIYIHSSQASIEANEFIENRAYRQGGGLYIAIEGEHDITIVENLFSKNKAGDYSLAAGGAMAIFSGENSIYGNTIVDNFSYNYGGGIYVYDNVAIYGKDGEPWQRENSPPGIESHNIYSGNSHGNNMHGGAHVFFRENQ